MRSLPCQHLLPPSPIYSCTIHSQEKLNPPIYITSLLNLFLVSQRKLEWIDPTNFSSRTLPLHHNNFKLAPPIKLHPPASSRMHHVGCDNFCREIHPNLHTRCYSMSQTRIRCSTHASIPI